MNKLMRIYYGFNIALIDRKVRKLGERWARVNSWKGGLYNSIVPEYNLVEDILCNIGAFNLGSKRDRLARKIEEQEVS